MTPTPGNTVTRWVSIHRQALSRPSHRPASWGRNPKQVGAPTPRIILHVRFLGVVDMVRVRMCAALKSPNVHVEHRFPISANVSRGCSPLSQRFDSHDPSTNSERRHPDRPNRRFCAYREGNATKLYRAPH